MLIKLLSQLFLIGYCYYITETITFLGYLFFYFMCFCSPHFIEFPVSVPTILLPRHRTSAVKSQISDEMCILKLFARVLKLSLPNREQKARKIML